MRVITKPRYGRVSETELSRLLKLYQTLASNLARAWHESSRKLHDLNCEWKARGKPVPEIDWLMAYDVVWQYYDLKTRAALYLCEPPSLRLTREALEHARNDTHAIDAVAVTAYVDLFPYTMFQHHCDLDWHSGQRYRLRLPKIKSIKAETVSEGFAYYIEARHQTPESPQYVEYGYVTIRDSQMLKLETRDYEEVLPYDNDGRCYYIQ